MSRRPTIAVVGLEDGPEAGFGPAVLACLDATRHRRLGVSLHPFEGGAFRSGVLDGAVRVAPPVADEAGFVDDLVAVVRREDVRVVLPGSQRVVFPLVRAAAALAAAGARVPLLDAARASPLANDGVQAACRRFGVPGVRTVDLAPGVQEARLPADLRYPATVIADDGTRCRAIDAHQVVRAERRLRPSGGGRVSLYETDPAQAYEFAAVYSATHKILASASVRVLADDERERPWVAVTMDHPALRDAARHLAAVARVIGPVVMSFQARGGRFLAADLRLGFPHWVEVGLAGGPNLVDVLVREVLGEDGSPGGHVAPGILFSQTAEDLVVELEEPVRLAMAGAR